MIPSATKPTRFGWMLLLWNFTLIVVLLGFMLWFLGRNSDGTHKAYGFPLPLMVGVAAAAACAALAITLLKIRSAAENDDPPDKLFLNSVLALAFSEFISFIGFANAYLSHAALGLYLPYAAVTVVINLGLILPFGLAYWASQDKRGDG
jgi:F0F1-type ATP synthase membrane subunit c/vacuolar-type H+-ATPase subunit K